MIDMSASEFKAKCLDIFDRVASGELDRVVITKRGRVVGVLYPPEKDAPEPDSIFGCMRGSVAILSDHDLTEPSCTERFDGELGVLCR